jgi:hypothetical protein
LNKPEDLDALLDIYLFSEINDADALDNFLKANNIDFDRFREKLEEVLFHFKQNNEDGLVRGYQ